MKMPPQTIATMLALTLLCSLDSRAALAITAAVAKKCDAEALKAFPERKLGTKTGVVERANFRRDCIARDGEVSPVPPTPGQAK